MTDPYDVIWHQEPNEGQPIIIARVPQAGNRMTQSPTFDGLKKAVRLLVAIYVGPPLQPSDVTLGGFREESEADFLASIS